MNKPTKVEVGQRWHSDYGSGDVTVTSINGQKVELSAGTWTLTTDMLTKDGYAFLGYAPGYGPEATKPEAPTVTPPHVCGLACYATGCQTGGIHPPQLGAFGVDRTVTEKVARSYVEDTAADGQPLSARAILVMRDRLPKPEPWRPSVDDFDLLPDAPGVLR